jgi:hypothetical protein
VTQTKNSKLLNTKARFAGVFTILDLVFDLAVTTGLACVAIQLVVQWFDGGGQSPIETTILLLIAFVLAGRRRGSR